MRIAVFMVALCFAISTSAPARENLSLARLHYDVDHFSRHGTVEEFLTQNIVGKNLDILFVHSSRSIQSGDDEFPRILLVTPDNRLTLTISGYPQGLGWETIEAMEQDSSTPRGFTFAEIVFPKNTLYPDRETSPVAWNGYGPPGRRCLGCHRSGFENEFRPIVPKGPSDNGFWGWNGRWTQETLAGWENFKSHVAPGSRYAFFTRQIQDQKPDQLTRRLKEYFDALSEP